jgi:hypothetical protein
MLPPYSPKTVLLKNTQRQRMVNSEPRKTVNTSSSHTSTIQRRLPFERMMLLK